MLDLRPEEADLDNETTSVSKRRIKAPGNQHGAEEYYSGSLCLDERLFLRLQAHMWRRRI